MYFEVLLVLFAGLFFAAWTFMGRHLESIVDSVTLLNSRPLYFKLWAVLWVILPAFAVLFLGLVIRDDFLYPLVVDYISNAENLSPDVIKLTYSVIEGAVDHNEVENYLSAALQPAAYRLIELREHYSSILLSATCVVGLTLLGVTILRTRRSSRAQRYVERWGRYVLFLCSVVAVVTSLGIILSLLFETLRFFQMVSPLEFLFGTTWSPMAATGADKTGGMYGAVPLFSGTLLIALIALIVSLPVGLYSAVYLSEYASVSARSVIKPMLEVLAGIPTVVYGFFAALIVAPAIREAMGELSSKLIMLGVIDTPFEVSSESAIAAGVVIGVMLIPFISSMADDVFRAVPHSLRDGSLGLGATHRETVINVVFPAALPGVVGGVMLAISRAIGETMIVVMAAGLAAKLTANPFDSVTTVTVQIVTLLVGDQEFGSAETLSAFALGLMLFVVTLMLNIIALHIVRRYREQYD